MLAFLPWHPNSISHVQNCGELAMHQIKPQIEISKMPSASLPVSARNHLGIEQLWFSNLSAGSMDISSLINWCSTNLVHEMTQQCKLPESALSHARMAGQSLWDNQSPGKEIKQNKMSVRSRGVCRQKNQAKVGNLMDAVSSHSDPFAGLRHSLPRVSPVLDQHRVPFQSTPQIWLVVMKSQFLYHCPGLLYQSHSSIPNSHFSFFLSNWTCIRVLVSGSHPHCLRAFQLCAQVLLS